MADSGWTRFKLEDLVVHLGRGATPKYVEQSDTTAIDQKCVRGGRVSPNHGRPHDATVPVKQQAVLVAGDVCVNSTGTGTIGRVGLWLQPELGRFFADTHVTIVRPDKRRVVPKFLVEALSAPPTQKLLAETCFMGSTNQIELSRSAFGLLEILLPSPTEQHKIADILSSFDDVIEKTETVIAQLQVVKKAMMQELLTRGLPGRHKRFKMTEIGEMPEDWELVPVSQACELILDCKNRTPPVVAGPFAVVRTPNVRNGRLVREELRTTDEGSFREWTARGEPRSGDVLITREAPVGEVCLVPDDIRVCLGQRMMLYRPNPTAIINTFLLVALQGPGVQERLRLVSGGSTVGHVRVGDIRSLPIPLPPLDEQQTIAGCVLSVGDREQAEVAALNKMRELKVALSSVLLTGELRVNVDQEVAA